VTAVPAHLNGGPKDDQYLVVEHDELRVSQFRPVNLFALVADEHGPITTSITQGAYRMRRDSLQQPVPRDLTGTIEFDWQGWLR
jgi:hypothetical protein